jgi:CBS domain-containing protein
MNKDKNNLSKITDNKLRKICSISNNSLDSSFLCKSVSSLKPSNPILLELGQSIKSASDLLKNHSVGCIIITDKSGKLAGVFSERDYISKIYNSNIDIENSIIDPYMTKDPFTISFDSAIAYCLCLMSEGGFRHLPIVDDENYPVGIISVKDVINFIVENSISDLLTI